VHETRTLGEADVETIERRYDAEGRLIEVTAQRVPSGARVEVREHERDAAGNATVTRIDYDGDGQADRLVSRTFDSAGRVLEEIETDASAFSAARAQRWFTYDAQGRLLTRTEGTDRATAERQELRYDDAVDLHEPAAVAYVFPEAPARDFETTQVHEREGEELVRTEFFGPDGALDFARRFERDAAGRLLSRSDWRPGPHDRLILQRHWRYSYDEAGRLIEERCDGCTPDAPLADGRDDASVTYEYAGPTDEAPIRETARFGLAELVERRELTYGDRGLLAETRCWGCPEARGSDEPARFTSEYDGAGRLIREARFAPGEAQPVSVRELAWADAGGLPTREVLRDGSGRLLETIDRELDAAGRVVVERTDGSALSAADGAPDVVVRYQYECPE
jgi:YD repeat-containing protein